MTCPINDDTNDITLNYARNNQLWLDDFANVFEKMITTGYNTDELISFHVPIDTFNINNNNNNNNDVSFQQYVNIHISVYKLKYKFFSVNKQLNSNSNRYG